MKLSELQKRRDYYVEQSSGAGSRLAEILRNNPAADISYQLQIVKGYALEAFRCNLAIATVDALTMCEGDPEVMFKCEAPEV